MPRTSHRFTKYSDQEVETAVASSSSWSELIRNLDDVPGGATLKHLRSRCSSLGLDTSHFDAGWSTGRRAYNLIPLDELLRANIDYNGSALRRRLIQEGLKEARCEDCGKSEWLGNPIPLELEHIDGNTRNNSIENLKILCCNCHALTPTWRRRKSSLA